ncbi:MAG: hypothetical protein J5701_02750 [Bacteroidales bacterium]|nr:hypothetical protein [Bacteroidales bacterium]
MKPLKSLSGFSIWLLRIAVALFLVMRYWHTLKGIDVHAISLEILCICVYCIFGILLLAGGIRKGASLTVISGLFIALFSIYFAYTNFNGNWLNENMLLFIFPFSAGVYFLANGNK